MKQRHRTMIPDPVVVLDLRVRKNVAKSRRFKRDDDVTKIAREFTGDAIYTLLDLLESDDLKLRLDAAKEILNRGWGKPKEFIVQEEEILSEEDLRARIAHLDKQIKSMEL